MTDPMTPRPAVSPKASATQVTNGGLHQFALHLKLAATKEGGRIPTNAEKDAEALQQVAAAFGSAPETKVDSANPGPQLIAGEASGSGMMKPESMAADLAASFDPTAAAGAINAVIAPPTSADGLEDGVEQMEVDKKSDDDWLIADPVPLTETEMVGAFLRDQEKKDREQYVFLTQEDANMETVKDTLSELTEHIHRLSVGDFQADVAGPQTDGPKRVEVEPAGDGLFRLTCFPEPFPHVSRYVSSLLGGLSVQEVAQLFDVFRGKPLTRAGVERALECYIIVKRAKEHGKLLARKFLKPSEKRGLGYGEMHEVNAGAAMEMMCPTCLTPRDPEKKKCLFCKSTQDAVHYTQPMASMLVDGKLWELRFEADGTYHWSPSPSMDPRDWLQSIWPTKEELKGESPLDAALEDPRGRGNYASAEIHSEDIRKPFLEERDMDMVLGPLTAQEAASICGCGIPELCPGPMVAIDEGDKIRTIYDGSWGGANAHIQANTDERTTAPTVMDCLHGIHWLQASQKEPGHKKLPYAHWDWPKQDDQWMLLKADVTKAHRRVKILAPEWRYQVAKLGDEWWINKVGTYGMASAQLYWGRLASALLRLLYHVYPMVDWGFVFVDDFCWLLRKSLATSAILLFLVAFGCPLSWKKTAIGLSNTWLGFIMTPDLQLVRMAPTKHELVMAVLDKMVDNQTFTKQELDSALGRLQWATNCCPLTKPFNGNQRLSPQADPTSFSVTLRIYSIASLRKTTIIQPLTLLRAPGGGQAMQVPQIVERHTLEVGSATTQTQKSIRGPVLLPLASDNQGNIYGLLNDYTRKMPTAGLLMEIMFQLTATSCSLMPSHVKRDFNQWADDLTHPSFEGFDSSLELMVAPLLSEFKIFPWILQHLDAQGDLPGPEPVERSAPAPKLKKRRKC
eukprot:symbB.v1.2.021151.t1/scaffold1776.1/size101794/2